MLVKTVEKVIVIDTAKTQPPHTSCLSTSSSDSAHKSLAVMRSRALESKPSSDESRSGHQCLNLKRRPFTCV